MYSKNVCRDFESSKEFSGAWKVSVKLNVYFNFYLFFARLLTKLCEKQLLRQKYVQFVDFRKALITQLSTLTKVHFTSFRGGRQLYCPSHKRLRNVHALLKVRPLWIPNGATFHNLRYAWRQLRNVTRPTQIGVQTSWNWYPKRCGRVERTPPDIRTDHAFTDMSPSNFRRSWQHFHSMHPAPLFYCISDPSAVACKFE